MGAVEMETERKGVPELLRDALEPLLEVLPAFKAEEEGLKAQLDAKREERKRIERTLIQAGLIEASTPPPAKAPSKPQNRSYGSKEMLKRLQVAVEQLGDEPFTVRELADLAGCANMTAQNGLEGLRAMGVVRLVGRRKPKYSSGPAAHYAKVGNA